ncbi:phage integrase family protein, partial [Azohydromonas lata]|uniref:phage integrase family protein n=1 Tax=Azohydromonas lata TaxID=45677 RepID=UPI0027380AAE
MKTRRSAAEPAQERPLLELPDAAALSALRAWHEGLSSRDAVARFIPERRPTGGSSRSVIGHIRRQLAAFAASRQREDLARLFTGTARKGAAAARAIAQAVEALRSTPQPQPLIGDDVGRWLPSRAATVLRNAGIRTLAELTLRVPRRRRWWSGIAGLGPAMAREIEGFFAAHPELTERARALVAVPPQGDVRPWEHIIVPADVDGTQGAFRAPRASCSLRADNDYEAVQSWLALHEAPATQRAYRKEAERLLLWGIA